MHRSRRAWAAARADRELDGPSRHTWPSGESSTLRRVPSTCTDEYARHVGHADPLREAVDGLVGEDPPRSR